METIQSTSNLDDLIASMLYDDLNSFDETQFNENTDTDKLIKDLASSLAKLTKNINQEEKVKDTAKQSNTTNNIEIDNLVLSEADHKDFINSLHYKMETEILPMSVSSFSIQLVVNINGHPVQCLIDTGATTNIISSSIVKKVGLEYCVDKTIKANLVGVGSQKSPGLIPYFDIEIENVKYPICAMVADLNCKTQMILGISFLSYYQVTLDFKNRKVLINGNSTIFKTMEH